MLNNKYVEIRRRYTRECWITFLAAHVSNVCSKQDKSARRKKALARGQETSKLVSLPLLRHV